VDGSHDLTVLFFDAIILLVGYAMIKASTEKIKEDTSNSE